MLIELAQVYSTWLHRYTKFPDGRTINKVGYEILVIIDSNFVAPKKVEFGNIEFWKH